MCSPSLLAYLWTQGVRDRPTGWGDAPFCQLLVTKRTFCYQKGLLKLFCLFLVLFSLQRQRRLTVASLFL